MLKTRVITAVIGFIIALGAITLGGPVYDVLITLLALLGWREFVLLGKAKHVRMSIIWGYISMLLLMIAFACHQYILAIAILVLSLFANYMLCTFGENKYSMASVSFSVFGLLYVGIGMISLLMIRHDSIYMSLTMNYITGEQLHFGYYYLLRGLVIPLLTLQVVHLVNVRLYHQLVLIKH